VGAPPAQVELPIIYRDFIGQGNSKRSTTTCYNPVTELPTAQISHRLQRAQRQWCGRCGRNLARRGRTARLRLSGRQLRSEPGPPLPERRQYASQLQRA
jgi:hypothetical protein